MSTNPDPRSSFEGTSNTYNGIIVADYDRYDFLYFQFKSGILPFETQRVLLR